MKKCPFCSNDINDDDVKCKQCLIYEENMALGRGAEARGDCDTESGSESRIGSMERLMPVARGRRFQNMFFDSVIENAIIFVVGTVIVFSGAIEIVPDEETISGFLFGLFIWAMYYIICGFIIFVKLGIS